MDYIYNGELQIFQEDLDRFLDVAQRLKIQGLVADPNAHQEEKVNNLGTEDFKNEKSPNLKTQSYQAERLEQRVLAKVDTSINSENISEVNGQIEENMLKNAENMWDCKVCGRSFAQKKHAKQHNCIILFFSGQEMC